jgi:hypothetical protein
VRTLRERFERNVSKYGVPFFEAESKSEGDFLAFCGTADIATHRQTILEYDGKEGAESDRFIYLALKSDDGNCVARDGEGFVDWSAACPGGGAFGTCGAGAKQVAQVLLKPEGIDRIGRLGFLSSRQPSVPRVLLISSPIRDALLKARATGCEIIPTDTPGCSQLRITTETPGPTRIGSARMGKRCPCCGRAKMFLANSERYFHRGDLAPVDFQFCRIYWADNVGQFEILNGFPIVSQRIFDLLLKLKVRGLDRYTTDPPVRHAVVQVRDV